MPSYIKKEIAPYIVVYKKAVDKPEEVVSFFQKTIDQDKLNYLKPWEAFGEPGTNYPKGLRNHINSFPINNFNEPINSEEEFVVKKLFKMKDDVFNDYILEHKDKDLWPENILNSEHIAKNLNQSFSPAIHEFAKEGEDPKNSYLLGFHLDSIFNPPEEGRQHVITMMVYLNDDYLEGEISFLIIGDNKSIISYKPEAGDLVLFPSFYPFYHSVNKCLGEERYSMRTSYDLNLKNPIPKNNNTFTENMEGNLPEAYYNKEKVIYIDGKDL